MKVLVNLVRQMDGWNQSLIHVFILTITQKERKKERKKSEGTEKTDTKLVLYRALF